MKSHNHANQIIFHLRAVPEVIHMGGGGVDGKHFFVLRVEGSAKFYDMSWVCWGCPGGCGMVTLLECPGYVGGARGVVGLLHSWSVLHGYGGGLEN
jgi:hypothetical protein